MSFGLHVVEKEVNNDGDYGTGVERCWKTKVMKVFFRYEFERNEKQ